MADAPPTFETIKLLLEDGPVATLMLARADKHNALNARMIAELRTAAAWLAAERSVRVIVLTGAGKTFCAGGDLGWMREQAGKDRTGRIQESSQLAHMLRELDSLPKPLIARVQGAAYGGGIGMLSVCDSAIVAADANFALTETRLGLVPATIGPYVLRRMGEGNARRVFMSGRRFDGAAAVALGLATRAVPAAELDDAVRAETAPYLACAPGAVAAAKALCLRLARERASEAQLDWTAELLADRWESAEAAEGIDAFFARRQPAWRAED